MDGATSRRSSFSTSASTIEMESKNGLGQGESFLALYQNCQNVHERLICLKYESEFCAEYKCKPIHRYYFCLPSNPSEQFYTFSCLAGWLIKSKGITSQVASSVKSLLESSISSLNPQEYEDPNVTITAILDVIRNLTSLNGQNGSLKNIDFAPPKLKQGSGIEVITVLSILTEVALKASVKSNGILVKVQTLTNEVANSYSDPSTEQSFGQDEDDDIEMNLEESHYTLEGDEEDDEATDHRFVDSFNPGSLEEYKSSSYLNSNASEVLISQVDEATWAQEVERVLPQLKVTLSTDARFTNSSSSLGLSDKIDWRIRLTQLNNKSTEMNGIFSSTIDLIGRIVKEVKSTQVSLESREKYLSSQFESLIKEYISIKEQLDSLQSKYTAASSGITSKTKELSLISDELESIKQDMEERGNKMTDGSPLVSLRKALSSLKSELINIEIRIGVASHSILQYCIKDSMAQMAMKKGDGYLNESVPYNSLQHSASIESTFL